MTRHIATFPTRCAGCDVPITVSDVEDGWVDLSGYGVVFVCFHCRAQKISFQRPKWGVSFEREEKP